MTDDKHDHGRLPPEPYRLSGARRGRRDRHGRRTADSDSSGDERAVRVRLSPSPAPRDRECCRTCYEITCRYLCYTSYILAAVVCLIVIWGTASGNLRITVTMGV